MRSNTTVLLLLALLVVFGAMPVQAAKVDVCHLPPGNPDNWHTISVSENAVDAHLNHGDLLGSCLENCETLCDDGDACTQDVEANPDECVCLANLTPVNCDDSNPCTADSCNSDAGGCVYDTAILDGNACDDGDPDTTNDVCTGGVCDGTLGDACDGNFCQNGSTCVPNSDGATYTCDCAPGFTGIYCEIDPCGFNHCQNGGTCVRGDSGTTYTCECPAGYSGSNCGIEEQQGYDCDTNNPCTPENASAGNFYFPASAGADQFIQCSEFGQCFVMPCAPGTIWSQEALTCVSP